ncbi:type II CAAX prenyl endopeptidase Rce1 family protein [Streptomyces sp. NPDC014894]|uniref:CPBP family glutamic-type intramembrane protease n=1 Tax=Streptomyces sp. NPDC014894 TaxID=3364931 RepID=UPI0036F96D2E
MTTFDHAIRGRGDTRRAYRTVVALIACAAGPTLWSSGLRFARLLGADPGAWTLDVTRAVHAGCTIAAGLWLLALINTRSRTDWPSRRALQLGGAAALAAADLTDRMTGLQPDGTATDYRLPSAFLLVWLVREVLLHRDIDLARLGVRPDTGRPGRSAVPTWHIYGLVLLLFVTAAVAMNYLRLAFPGLVPAESQLTAIGVDNPLTLITRCVWTAVVEEVVVTGTVITLLRAADRPAWEWVLLPVAVRVLGHLYLGISATAQILVGAGVAYLYVVHRHLAPIVMVHGLYSTGPAGIALAITVTGAVAIRDLIRSRRTRSAPRAPHTEKPPADSPAAKESSSR